MKKYYHAQNAARGKIGGVAFQITEIVAGTAFGVYATEDAKEIEALDKLVADPSSAVTTYGEGDYEADLKKKPPTNDSVSLNNYGTKPLPQSSLKGTGAAVVVAGKDEGGEVVTPIPGVVDSVEEALSTAKVEVAAPIEGPAPEQTKRGEKRSRKT